MVEKSLENGETIFDWNYKSPKGKKNPLPYGDLRNEQLAQTLNAFPNYYVFTFVRNPWQRCLSAYLHLKRAQDPKAAWVRRKIKIEGFDEFVDDIYDYIMNGNDRGLSGYERYHTLPQFTFLPYGGRDFFNVKLLPGVNLNFTGRVENFTTDFYRVTKELGLRSRLRDTHLNKSHYYKPWKEYYTPEAIEKVREMYLLDFHLLNYSTDFNLPSPGLDCQRELRKK
jgi:hypothetical protein